MLTKEECLEAVKSLEFTSFDINSDVKSALLQQLIEEHFYIPPIITAFKVYSDSTFQSFAKKELIEYIHTIYHNWKNACIVNERVIKMNYKLQSEIDELKSNPPLKFEELKENEWYWDNKKERYFKIFELDVPNKEIIAFDYWGLGFEENRFYRKQVEECKM